MAKLLARRRVAALLVVTAAMLGAATPASALTREQAVTIAKQILKPEQHANAVLYGLPRPLVKDSSLVSDEPSVSPSGNILIEHKPLHRVYRREWFFWEDLDYGADFPHASRLLLLNATTGAPVFDQEISGRPLISNSNGHFEFPPFLTSPGVPSNHLYVLYSSHPLPGAAATRSAPALPSSVLRNGFMRDDCLVTIGDRSVDEHFSGDFDDFEEWATGVGMRSFPMPANSTGADLIQRVHELTTMASNPCHNILLVLAGHGFPPPSYVDPKHPDAVTSALPSVETGIEWSPAFDPAEITGTFTFVQAPDLATVLEDNPQTSFEIVMDTCFGGRFAPYLAQSQSEHKLNNLQLVASSADATEVSWAHVPAGYIGQPGTTPTPKYPGQPIVPVPGVAVNANPPRQFPPEGDYVHAFVDSLSNWSGTHSGFLDLNGAPLAFAPALSRAARDAQRNDFTGGTLLWEHPTVLTPAPFIVTYHYRVHISVTGATASMHEPDPDLPGHQIVGSVKSSWTLDASDVPIRVDYTNRTAGNTASPSGGAVLYALTGSASGTTSFAVGGNPTTCNWTLETTTANRAALDISGNDYGSVKPPILENGFQDTRELGVAVSPYGNPSTTESCPPDPTPSRSTRVSAQVFLGTADSYCSVPLRLVGFTIPIWDLGKDVITLPSSPMTSNTALCSFFFGKPIPTGGIAQVSGSYDVTLTLLPSKHRRVG